MAWRRQAAVVRCHGPRGGGEPWPSPHVPLGFGEAPLTSMAGLTAEPAGFDHAELHLAGSSLVGAGGPRSVLWGGMRGVERSAMAGSGRAPGPRGAYGFRGAGEPRGVRCRFWMGESRPFCVAVAVRSKRKWRVGTQVGRRLVEGSSKVRRRLIEGSSTVPRRFVEGSSRVRRRFVEGSSKVGSIMLE